MYLGLVIKWLALRCILNRKGTKMGRTLHYEVQKEYVPNLEEDSALIALSKAYNKKYNWTCENVWLSNMSYLCLKSYEVVEKASEHYLSKGFSEVETIMALDRDKLVMVQNTGLRGFTKTGSNEFNSHTVIQFMLDASKIIPHQTFSLRDEGDSLYCPLLIRNGKAKPDEREMRDSMAYWADKDYLHNGSVWDVTHTELYFQKLIEAKPRFGNINKYIRPISKRIIPEQFKTEIIELKNGGALKDIINDFLLQEYDASAQYYDNIRAYPT